MTTDGELRQQTGDFYKKRAISRDPSAPARWERMYWRSVKGKAKTFKQAEALFAYENGWYWPSRDWPFMPLDEADFYRKVPDVPMHRLIPKTTFEAPTLDIQQELSLHEGI